MNSYQFESPQLNVRVSVSYQGIDLEQIIKEEVGKLSGEKNTPELQAYLVAAISARIVPGITVHHY